MAAEKMKIALTRTGEGTLECVGDQTYPCVGKAGMSYPKSVYINPKLKGQKQNPHYSSKYSCHPYDDPKGRCIMKYSILVVWQWGVFIHEWVPGASHATGGPSHGCFHLNTGDAEKVYNWVDSVVHLTISYPWPATSPP